MASHQCRIIGRLTGSRPVPVAAARSPSYAASRACMSLARVPMSGLPLWCSAFRRVSDCPSDALGLSRRVTRRAYGGHGPARVDAAIPKPGGSEMLQPIGEPLAQHPGPGPLLCRFAGRPAELHNRNAASESDLRGSSENSHETVK
ncbi:hypothetical protein GPN2_10443 [Streptomyces murinus]